MFLIMSSGYTIRITAKNLNKLILWCVESKEPRMMISKEVIKRFNKLHSDIQVTSRYIKYEEFEMKLKVALAGNKMPDLISCWY